MSQRKRQYVLIHPGRREIVTDRRKRPIVSKMLERPPPLPPKYEGWKQGFAWTEVENGPPPIPDGHELIAESFHWEDQQVQRVYRKFEIRPIKKEQTN